MKKISLLIFAAFVAIGSFAQTKGKFTMTTTTYKNEVVNGKEPVVSQFHFMNNEVAFVNKEKDGKTTVIMNPESHMITTLMDKNGSKTGTKMKMPSMLLKETVDKDPMVITVTSETKTINGYNCTKYTMENGEYTGYMWMTKDVKWNYADFANKMGKMLSRGNKGTMMKMDAGMTGFPVLVYQKEKNGKNAYETSYSDIVVGNCNEDLFSTAGYEITDMSVYQK